MAGKRRTELQIELYRKGITIQKLSRHSGLSVPYVSHIVSGRSFSCPQKLYNSLEMLGILAKPEIQKFPYERMEDNENNN